MTDDRPTAEYLADAPPPPEVPSVGLWGPSGGGKTQFALSICTDPSYCPVLYADTDAGIAAVRQYEHADVMVHREVTRLSGLVTLIADVAAGKVRNRAGVPVRTLVYDAASSLQSMELRYLPGLDAAEQAKKLAPQFQVLFGHLRELVVRHKVGVVGICHSKQVSEKAGQDTIRSEVPDLFPSIRRPWLASLRHVWEIYRTRGAKGPAYPLVALRTEPRGRRGIPGYVEYMKTSNIAFAQWMAGQYSRQEEYSWDTGLVEPDQQPTLAMLLQVAAELQLEQGQAIASSPAAARALAALEAASALRSEAEVAPESPDSSPSGE